MSSSLRRFASICAALIVTAALALIGADAAWAECGPSTRGIAPASGTVGTTVPATVTGTGLTGAVAGVFGEPGLTVTVQSTSDTAVSLQLQIDAAAEAGERFITLDTAGGTVAVSFSINPVGGPVVTSVSPTAEATQGFGLDLTLTGEGLSALTAANVTVSGSGVTVVDVVPGGGGTQLDLSFDVTDEADLGTHAVVIESPLGGVVLPLYVLRPAPSIDRVSPGAGEVGAVVPLRITGMHLTGAALVVTSGTGDLDDVTISDVTTPDDFTLLATLSIDPNLGPENEPRLLIVTTESGQDTAEFYIVAAGVPSVTQSRPAAAEPGQTVGVTLRGLNLTGASVSTSSGEISVQNVVVEDDETVTLDVVVGAGATPGTEHPLLATVGPAEAETQFSIVAPGEPFIGTVRPPFGNRGDTLAIFLDGVNLGTVVAGSGVTLSGPKIVESNAESVDDATVRAILDLDATASIGFRDVTVTTSGGSATRTAAFRVNIPGQIPIIDDVSPTVVEPGTTTEISVSGSGFLGAGITIGGPGASVSDPVVDSTGTAITFDLVLEADAPAESRPLIVVTENGTATCGILSRPAEIELRAAQFVKTGSVIEAVTGGYRLFLYEFSINERFDAGIRTHTVAGSGPRLTLSRLDAENVRRAVRDLPFGYVRVRAVTATSQLGASAVVRFRR